MEGKKNGVITELGGPAGGHEATFPNAGGPETGPAVTASHVGTRVRRDPSAGLGTKPERREGEEEQGSGAGLPENSVVTGLEGSLSPPGTCCHRATSSCLVRPPSSADPSRGALACQPPSPRASMPLPQPRGRVRCLGAVWVVTVAWGGLSILSHAAGFTQDPGAQRATSASGLTRLSPLSPCAMSLRNS